ncbi:hypothetical protein FOA43_004034 [Brettanomyces nanus]|uniref:Uncharacterized protein n=1 Tax=Eeniella nana TaxID=13502 RepID=A0A875SA09_EENNA|nr:uncharacterized protein FOA43_004034 [Brettanomyces nanus]QPG76642.1 hypothetical protein FOA43_004034 [Brettanomyces nanus]
MDETEIDDLKDLHSLDRVTKLIPRQVLSHKIQNVDPVDRENSEENIVLKRIKCGGIKGDTEDIGDLFGVSKKEEDGKEDIAEDEWSTVISNRLNRFTKRSGNQQNQQETVKNTVEDRPTKLRKITDLNMDEFYRTNSELIRKGDLNVDKQIQQNSKVTYYTTGNNNLSSVINFTEKNKDRLNKKPEN